jgi:hypothetical protein
MHKLLLQGQTFCGKVRLINQASYTGNGPYLGTIYSFRPFLGSKANRASILTARLHLLQCFWASERHRAKFSRLGDLVPRFVHSCIYIHTDILPRQMSNILTSYKLLKYNRVHVTENLDCVEVLKSRQIAVFFLHETVLLKSCYGCTWFRNLISMYVRVKNLTQIGNSQGKQYLQLCMSQDWIFLSYIHPKCTEGLHNIFTETIK